MNIQKLRKNLAPLTLLTVMMFGSMQVSSESSILRYGLLSVIVLLVGLNAFLLFKDWASIRKDQKILLGIFIVSTIVLFLFQLS